MERLRLCNRLEPTGSTLSYIRYHDDFPVFPLSNLWSDTQTGSAMEKVYVVQTNTKVIQRCILMATDPGDLVLDPTCGSGTTAHVAEQWGRRWITIDTSRVALALARTRLMCARFPYYFLADSSEGAAKEAELTGRLPVGNGYKGDVRQGFVYKRVPHVTLKSIAQNPDIHEGMTPEEIDAAVGRHSQSELLVDQPYEDRSKVRVTGRFTVESLSPHRVLDEERPPPTGTEVAAAAEAESPTFEQTILDNLRKAGVHNTFKGRRSASTASTCTPAPGSRPRASSPTPTASPGGWRSASAPNTAPSGPTTSRKRPRRPCGAPASTCLSSVALPSTRTPARRHGSSLPKATASPSPPSNGGSGGCAFCWRG